MTDQDKADFASALLSEIRNNLEKRKESLGDQADSAYFEKQISKIFRLKVAINELEL